MGGGVTKSSPITNSELAEFVKLSNLPSDTIVCLYSHFENFSAKLKDDGVIDFEEFCLLVGKPKNALAEKMFCQIDTNNDKRINFKEFLKFISIFINNNNEDKKMFLFKTLAEEQSQKIRKSTLIKLFEDFLKVEIDIVKFFNNHTLNFIISKSFDLEFEEEMSYESFCSIINSYPSILNWISLDIKKVTSYLKILKPKSTSCFG